MLQRLLCPLALCGLAASALLMTACGDQRAVSSRHHIGTSYQATYGSELLQLPWRPPALGETHYRRGGAPGYLPGSAPSSDSDQETHPDQRWRAGRRALSTDHRVKH